MNTTLIELLEDVLDNVEDAGDNACNGSAHDSRELISEHIDAALERIDRALREIEGAGTPRTDVAVSDIESASRMCRQLAQQALDEQQSTRPCDAIVGDHLKTIRQILTQPGGLRELAGIDDREAACD